MAIVLKMYRGFNSASGCGICGEDVGLIDGATYLYDLETGQAVCGECAYQDAPVLVGLLNLSIAAQDYHNEGEDESELPKVMEALRELCAEMEIEEGAAVVQALAGIPEA